jgi:hypothetical protein
MAQELVRFWIADRRSSIAAASGGEVSYEVLYGAEATLSGNASEISANSTVKPPSALVAAAWTGVGSRILVAEFNVTQVCKSLASSWHKGCPEPPKHKKFIHSRDSQLLHALAN